MGKAGVAEICSSIELAIKAVRDTRRRSFQISDTLETFWLLQDSTARLVEAADDHPTETFEAMEKHPALIKDLVDLLATSRDFHKVSGVEAACTAINESLLLLEYFRERSRSDLAFAAGC